MLPRQAPTDWVSLHVFIHDFGRLNDCLRQCLNRLPVAFWRQAFYIRYWHGGPHLRLRFRDPQWTPLVTDRLAHYLQQHAFVSTLQPEPYYRAYAGHMEPGMAQDWYANGSLHYLAYHPETERYGGPAGLPLCEAFFCWDSAHCLGILAAEPEAVLDKLLLGYCLTYAGVLRGLRAGPAQTGETAGLLPDASSSAWLDAQTRARLAGMTAPLQKVASDHAAGLYFPAYLAPLQARLLQLGDALQRHGVADLPAIFHALLHMSFNRAGVTPARETTIRLFAAHAEEALERDACYPDTH